MKLESRWGEDWLRDREKKIKEHNERTEGD